MNVFGYYSVTAAQFYKMSFKIYTILEIQKGFYNRIIPQNLYHIFIHLYIFLTTIYLQVTDLFGIEPVGYCLPKNDFTSYQEQVLGGINILISIYTLYCLKFKLPKNEKVKK